MAITTENIEFKSADGVFSKVRRFLSSFDSAGMIDEGEFPGYAKEVMKNLGMGVYRESDAVTQIRNYKGKLPEDFAMLHAAYKCSPHVDAKDITHLQGDPVSYYQDVTWELLEGSSKCEIEVIRNSDDRVLEKVTVRQYIKETPVSCNFQNPVLLRLSPNVKGRDCTDDCENKLSSSVFEITISGKQLLTNFANDHVYLQYYAFPEDENGIPEIPDLVWVEKTIEWYIIAETLKGWWFNNSVPDMEKKWQVAEAEHQKWLADARYERKAPTFQNMVNKIRRQRGVNKVILFT